MTIHSEHPFRPSEAQREAGRQLRGRLGARVSIWAAGTLNEPAPDQPTARSLRAAGLTVSSMLVAAGDPWRVVALLDPDAALTARLRTTGRATLSLVNWPDRHLADVFAGLAPAPGGPFRAGDFADTPWGPRLVSATTWAGLELESVTELGWSLQVTCVAASITLGTDREPLHHVRGHYVIGGHPG